jgi:hypothetical protein
MTRPRPEPRPVFVLTLRDARCGHHQGITARIEIPPASLRFARH